MLNANDPEVLSCRLVHELRNRPWLQLEDPVVWGDAAADWDLQEAGLETEYLAGRLGMEEYGRLKAAVALGGSFLAMHFQVHSFAQFLAWARASHQRLQQLVPQEVCTSLEVVFDTLSAEDACKITYYCRNPQHFRALLLALLRGLERIPA